jgi:hypothetical protein
MQAHHKHTVWTFIMSIVISFTSRHYVYGGPGGIRTPVQNSFALKGLQLYRYYTVLYLVSQLIVLPKDEQSLITVDGAVHCDTCPASKSSCHTKIFHSRDVRQLDQYGSV